MNMYTGKFPGHYSKRNVCVCVSVCVCVCVCLCMYPSCAVKKSYLDDIQ